MENQFLFKLAVVGFGQFDELVFGVVFELLDEGLVLAAFDVGDVAVKVVGVVSVAPEWQAVVEQFVEVAVLGQSVSGGVGVQSLGVDAGQVILFVVKIGGGASALVVDLGEAVGVVVIIMALLDDPFLGFDSLVDALDVAEPVFAVKSVLDAVLALRLRAGLGLWKLRV